MKSRIYDCEVLHTRSTPKKNHFKYRYFTFCLDLDEIEVLSRKYFFFGEGFWKLFQFRANDFIFSETKSENQLATDLKTGVCNYAQKHGVTAPIARVELIAHMRSFGYAYNPANFYFCYSSDNQPVCAILEVTNTYREKKAYFLGSETLNDKTFYSQQLKRFYVSPFVDLGSLFDMKLALPTESLRLQIDSLLNGELQVHSLVTGNAVSITDLVLVTRLLRHPLISILIMVRIHYQALQLFLKKVPYFKKAS
jgi:DUF1365 family protein